MNEWISKHARKGFTWTSIAVNRDAKSLLHADSRNLKGSENFAVSFRDFKGGWLWIEGTDGQGPATQTKGNGTVVAGGSHNTKDSPLYFAPHLHHCVLPWTGTRFGLIAFTSSQVGSLNSQTREQLEQLKFRLPAPAAVAAPARHLPRPIACTVQGGLQLKQWWAIDNHNTPAHLLPVTHLITSVRDEGGAYIITSLSMATVVMASLSVGDLKRLRRNLVEITELAHVFSENFCVLLCGFIDEGLFGGLKAFVTRHKDASLVCAGLQALQLKDRVEEQLSSRHCTSQHDSKASAKAPDCKVADLENLLPLVDRAFTASNYLSIAWLYAGGEPQAALSVALGDGGQGYKALPTIAKVSDEGLGRLQPGDNRGRERGVIIVSDSTLIFKAGARIFVEIFQALGTFSNSMARQAESHMGRQPPQPRGS